MNCDHHQSPHVMLYVSSDSFPIGSTRWPTSTSECFKKGKLPLRRCICPALLQQQCGMTLQGPYDMHSSQARAAAAFVTHWCWDQDLDAHQLVPLALKTGNDICSHTHHGLGLALMTPAAQQHKQTLTKGQSYHATRHTVQAARANQDCSQAGSYVVAALPGKQRMQHDFGGQHSCSVLLRLLRAVVVVDHCWSLPEMSPLCTPSGLIMMKLSSSRARLPTGPSARAAGAKPAQHPHGHAWHLKVRRDRKRW